MFLIRNINCLSIWPQIQGNSRATLPKSLHKQLWRVHPFYNPLGKILESNKEMESFNGLNSPSAGDYDPRGVNGKRFPILSKSDIYELGSSLKKFNFSSVSTCLTMLVDNNESIYDILDIIAKDIKLEALESFQDGSPTLKMRALTWVERKLKSLMIEHIPKNGLALFAGFGINNKNTSPRQSTATSNEEEDVTRVFILFEPDFILNSTTYGWDSWFYPELLIANLPHDLNAFGAIIISSTSITVSRYSRTLRHSKHCQYKADLSKYDSHRSTIIQELKKLGAVCREHFSFDNVNDDIVIGLLCGITADDPGAEFFTQQFFINRNRILPKSLVGLPIDCQLITEKGSKESHKEFVSTIYQSTKFMHETWLHHQLNVIKHYNLVDFTSEPSELLGFFRDKGVGVVEYVTITKGVITKKTEYNFQNYKSY